MNNRKGNWHKIEFCDVIQKGSAYLFFYFHWVRDDGNPLVYTKVRIVKFFVCYPSLKNSKTKLNKENLSLASESICL